MSNQLMRNARFTTIRYYFIWAQNLVALIAFLIILILVQRSYAERSLVAPPHVMVVVFSIVSIISVYVSLNFQKIFLPDKKLREIIKAGMNDADDQGKVVEEVQVAYARLLPYFTARMAFCECPAVCGLILSIVSGNLAYYGIFGTLSFIAILRNRPNIGELRERVRVFKETSAEPGEA